METLTEEQQAVLVEAAMLKERLEVIMRMDGVGGFIAYYLHHISREAPTYGEAMRHYAEEAQRRQRISIDELAKNAKAGLINPAAYQNNIRNSALQQSLLARGGAAGTGGGAGYVRQMDSGKIINCPDPFMDVAPHVHISQKEQPLNEDKESRIKKIYKQFFGEG